MYEIQEKWNPRNERFKKREIQEREQKKKVRGDDKKEEEKWKEENSTI